MMAGTPKSDNPEDDPDRIDNAFTNEEGSIGEQLTAVALEKLGYHVYNTQAVLPDSYPVTGHIDGEVLGPDGDLWGWDNKRYGRFAYL